MKFIKFILLLILFTAIVAGSLLYYYHRQLSYKPEWYDPTAAPSVLTKGPAPVEKAAEPVSHPASQSLTRKSGRAVEMGWSQRQMIPQPMTEIERQLAAQGKAVIPQDQLMPLLLGTMNSEGGENLVAAVKAAKMTVHPNLLTVEMIIDADKVPAGELTGLGEKTVIMLRGIMQKTGLQELYIKADLYPRVQGEQMVLSPASTVAIGKVAFTLEEMEKKFAIPAHVNMDRFVFRDMELLEGKVVIAK